MPQIAQQQTAGARTRGIHVDVGRRAAARIRMKLQRLAHAGGAAGHLMIRQLAFVVLLTLRDTLPMSMPSARPRPRLPMTIRSILCLTA